MTAFVAGYVSATVAQFVINVVAKIHGWLSRHVGFEVDEELRVVVEVRIFDFLDMTAILLSPK